jgi:hypothetical protein
MSTKERNAHPEARGPVHNDVAFDPRDVRSGSILKFLLALAGTLVVVFLVSWWVLRLNESRVARQDALPTPARRGAGPMLPPEPRLQGVPGHASDPQQDLRDKLKADSGSLEQLRWADEKSGVAQIPIEDAMKMIAEKGLPPRAAKPAEAKKP